MQNSTNPRDPSLAEQAGTAFLWRVFGLGAEKIIFLLRILVLARLVAPEDFGLVAIGMTAMALMSRVTDFGLVAALIQNPAVNKSQLDTAWTISVLRGVGITVILFFAAPYIATLFEEPRATNIIRVFGLVALAQSAASIEIASVTRALAFRSLVSLRLLAAIVNTVVAISFARTLGAWALVLGTVSGAIAQSIASYLVAPYRPVPRLSGAATDRVFQFGRWIFALGLLGVLGEGLIRWIISTGLGVTELGLFFMAARLGYLPVQFITELVNQIAFPVYSRLQHERDKLARVFRSMLASLLVLMLPVGAIFFVLVPAIVDNVLGDQWAGATTVMQALVVASLVAAIGDAAEPLLKGIGQPSRLALIEALRLVVLLITAWALIESQGLLGIGLAEIIAAIVAQLAFVFVLRQTRLRPFAGLASLVAIIGTVAVLAAMLAHWIVSARADLIGLISAAAAAALFAATTGLLVDRWLDLGLLRRLAEPFPRIAAFAQRFNKERTP